MERLSGLPITDTATVPADDVEVLFRLGQESRQALRQFIETLPAEAWDATKEFKLLPSFLAATPRKIVVHILLHEIRHWAQIATILRLNGLTADFHDFLFSPVMGGEFRREPPTR
ncbi:MAG TPA: DinB family protein [Bryobacteraceae bacterium]